MFAEIIRTVLLCFVGLVALVAVPSATAQPGGGNKTPTYNLTDLLGLPNSFYQSTGEFITPRNAAGQVMIYGRSCASGVWNPVVWTIQANGTCSANDLVNRGTPDSVRELSVAGFNRHGLAVCNTGWAKLKDENDEWIFPAFVDHPLLGYQELSGPFSRNANVAGTNDAGTIVGQYQELNSNPADPNPYAYIACTWQIDAQGVITGPFPLGVDASEFYAADINSSGVIAANYYGYPVVAWFENGVLRMQSATSPQLFGVTVHALNDYPVGHPSLTLVGYTSRDINGNPIGYSRGFAWRPFSTANPVTVLGTLGGTNSVAHDVNSAGDIVGYSDSKRAGHHAFIFKNNKLTDLNTQVNTGGKVLQWATAINDAGDITGFMDIPRPINEQHGFMLRPK